MADAWSKEPMIQRAETTEADASTTDRLSTDVPGIDEILHGGLVPYRSYLVRGQPGTGKTILGLHYLAAGTENGETALFVNWEETTADIERNAAAFGFNLDEVHFLDLSPKSDFFADDQSYEGFESSAVESDPLTERITDGIPSLGPDRVFVDPLTQLRYLSTDEYQFRKQALSFMRLLSEQEATVLFTTQDMETTPDDDLQFMSDGIFELNCQSTGRTISVPKFRGSDVRSGQHALRITDVGLRVYPELRPGDHRAEFVAEALSSDIPEMDELLDGGIERGTISVISGPTGVGKTTTGTQFMKEATGRGERSVIYLFEESESTFLTRSEAVNIPVERMLDQQMLRVEEIEPLECSPQEFAHRVRTDVEENGTNIVLIDGIAGYRLSLRGDDEGLVPYLHALCRHLKNVGVTVMLIDEIETITGEFQATEGTISYLADNLVFLRHLELHGEMRKVIGVLKKRTSDFERTLREFKITEHGITVGDPLTGLQGILSGTPQLADWDPLSQEND